MKLLYFCNLFIICCSSFTIQPSNSLLLKSNLNICRCNSVPPNHFYIKKNNKLNNYLQFNDDFNNNDNINNDIDNTKLLNTTIFLLISLKILIYLTKSFYFV